MMCGRYYVDDDTAREIERVVRRIGADMKMKVVRDIHPSEAAPVILNQNDQLAVRMMNWGFPQQQSKGLVINARAESVADKRVFSSIYSRRCIIPAKHYYEWDADRNKAVFSRQDNRTLYMAGFYNLMDGLDRFVIITTAANESVLRVHDRMPLILAEEDIEDWIFDDRFWQHALKFVPMQLQRFQQYEQQSLFL